MTKFFHKHHASVIEVLYWGFLVYVFSMCVFPWFSGGGWIYVQNVWDRWQTLNAGVFAFAAAVVGFSIAKYRVEQDRMSELSSIRVLLPNALNKLSDYCGELKVFVENSFYYLRDKKGDFVCQEPVFPSDVYEVFSRAMRCSFGDVRDRLAEILELQQIVNSRVSGLGSFVRGNGGTRYNRINKYDIYYNISELKYMTDSLFSFSRRKMETVDDSVSIENSFRVYKFDLDSEFMNYVHKRKIR